MQMAALQGFSRRHPGGAGPLSTINKRLRDFGEHSVDMKMIFFSLIVIGAIVGPIYAAVECYKCEKCNNVVAGTTPTDATCDKCSTVIDYTSKTVKRECLTTCTDVTTGDILTKCCDSPAKCNSADVDPTVKPPQPTQAPLFKCYTCDGCPNPFPKDTNPTSTQTCAACKTTTTTADKKIKKECVILPNTCNTSASTKDQVVECCTSDLCNAGVSHSMKKSVLIGLLALAIGAIRY